MKAFTSMRRYSVLYQYSRFLYVFIQVLMFSLKIGFLKVRCELEGGVSLVLFNLCHLEIDLYQTGNAIFI